MAVMRLSASRRSEPVPGGVTGTVRLDKRTRNLVKRLKPGDIAVIDHVDIDRASAEALVQCGVAAVVNVSESISGRYPNLGPEIIAAAGVELIDSVGQDVFIALAEGDTVRIADGTIYRRNVPVGSGEVLGAERVLQLMDESRAGLSSHLEAFTANTMEHLRRERALLLDGVGVPEIRTQMGERHVLVVVRGYDYQEELASLRGYIRAYRPVLCGVDGGADALMEAGYKPDVIVGDMVAVSDKTLSCGAELVVHASREGRQAGKEHLDRLGLDGAVFAATGTSEDIAMLLADSKGASLIVSVGAHASLVEFLDRGRSGMASTFLTRLRVGPKLLDARGVSQVYRHDVRTWQLALLLLSGLLVLAVAIAATPAGHSWFTDSDSQWNDFVNWLQGLLQ
jgi:uncharacterized membrane-anchored protein